MIENNINIEYIELFSNNFCLRGMVHTPKNNFLKSPVVISHGYFSSNKIGPHRLYVKIANFLALNGYSVYRFDLSGMGESDGKIEDISYTNHKFDFMNIIKYVFKKENKKIISIGHCIGGSLSLFEFNNNPEYFEQIILLAPFFSTENIIFNIFKNTNLINELREKRYTYRKGLFTSSSFFTENTTKENFINYFENNNSLINIILAGKDQFIPIEECQQLFNKYRNDYYIIDNSDHNFLEFHDELLCLILNICSDHSKHL